MNGKKGAQLTLDTLRAIGVNVDENEENYDNDGLITSDKLEFLKEDKINVDIFDNPFWDLNIGEKKIKPLVFSNGKSQEDIVKEIVESVKSGDKVILLHGVCGSGKSAIALNVARALGKSSIVVPVKALQRQYEEDYMGKMYLIKTNGQKMKIAMLTGRENHDSLYIEGSSCNDPMLPENIKLTERNYDKLLEYYEENPLIRNKQKPSWKEMRRISVAPANPYWSPILPASIELNQMKDASKIKYKGCDGNDYIFYHRKRGCSYYDQYLAYKGADVIIFNSAKYKSEIELGRKPETEIDIIDEADEFLDSLYQQQEINMTRTVAALRQLSVESIKADEARKKIIEFIELEEKNKRILGVDEDKIFRIDDTKFRDIFKLVSGNPDLESELLVDEMNYANNLLEAAFAFKDIATEVYCTFRKDEDDNLYIKIVSTNLSSKFNEILNRSKALVLMSGTLHSESVLKNIFGINKMKIIEAETLNLGAMELIRTGKEIDCKYSNFTSKKHTRDEYLKALDESVKKSVLPTLIHVNAYLDLPTEDEKYAYEIEKLTTSEVLYQLQSDDKTGRNVSLFKSGLNDKLFTTKCSRGVDFPGAMCRSIVFTKYPYPNVSDIFWKILQKNHPNHYWDFYRDKAKREFLQRIYRALRSKDDHVFILSPDIRVLNAVRELQLGINKS
jgi:Rad3-related DNA helicase